MMRHLPQNAMKRPIHAARPALLLLLAGLTLHCASTQPPAVPGYAEMTVQELHAMRQDGTAPFILDLRNPEEVEIATRAPTC